MKYIPLKIVLLQSIFILNVNGFSQIDTTKSIKMEIKLNESAKIFGHRGIRGLYPENTIKGFQKALAFGADGIELDVVVNKEGQLVVSHEPYMKSTYCLNADGTKVGSKKSTNIYHLSQSDISKFDCGTKINKQFPEQEKVKETKPLFREVMDAIGKDVSILFEIKSSKSDDHIFQPEPKKYVEIILDEIEKFANPKQIIFMSFDTRILEELKRQWMLSNHKEIELKIVYLTYLPFKSVKSFLKDLSFKPYALGMFHNTVSRKKIIKAHEQEVKMFSWTVNSVKKAQKLSNWGIDGIITDYCNRFKNK